MNKNMKRIAIFLLAAMLSITAIPFYNMQSVQAAETEWSYQYTGASQKFEAPYYGKYRIEIYGASGGGANERDGGLGGYAAGTIDLAAGETFYIQVGQQGSRNGGASYNGGGAAQNGGYSGGGATSVTYTDTNLQTAVNSKKALMVAGGGGGSYSVQNSAIEFRGTPKIGSGGGENGTGVHTWGHGEIFGTQESYVLDTAEAGQACSNGGGAGGGGYRAGGASKHNYAGGAGGSGFIAKDKMYDSEMAIGKHIGNGVATITYLGSFDVTITVLLDNNGSFSNSGICSSYTMKKPCGSTFDFPDAVAANDYLSFSGYTVTSGDLKIQNKKATVGLKNVIVQANFLSTGINLNAQQTGAEVSLNWSDSTTGIYYKVFRGVDVDGVDFEENFDVQELDSFMNIEVSTSKIDIFENINSTYKIPTAGYYRVIIQGARGGGGSGAGGSHSAASVGGYGAVHTAMVYFNKGDILSFQQYSGGSARQLSTGYTSGRYARSGAGGNGLGLVLNNTVVISAGGGNGATSVYYWDGECHYDGLSGTVAFSPSSTSSTTTGMNGSDYCYGGFKYNASGGAGGGYPRGGGHNSSAENHTAGESYVIGSLHGKPSKNSSVSYSSTSLDCSIQLIEIAGGTTRTSGTYELFDKQAPDVPEATYDGGYTISGADKQYTVSWKQPKDNGSINMFQVNSYYYSGEAAHESKRWSTLYQSGFLQYRYIIDSSPSTDVSKVHTATTKNELLVNPSSTETYVHIAAEDKVGNLSGTLTIKIPGEKLIVYDKNNGTATNRYGDTFTTTATGSINSEMIKTGESIQIAANIGEITRTGYMQLLSTYNGAEAYTWNTKSDGSGTTYYSGQTISYNDISGASLVLYAVWEPITYYVNLHQNLPTDATHEIKNLTNDFTLNTSDKEDIQYTKEFRYDGTKVPAPNTVFSLEGWSIDNQKWWATGGTNGGTSGKEYLPDAINLTTVYKATLNLYPKWTKHKYTIHYNRNGLDITTTNIYGDTITTDVTGSTAATNCQYDTNVKLSKNTFARVGYNFKEWNTKPDGSGTSFKNEESLEKPNFVSTDNGSFTLYAIWEPIRYNIAYDSNRGTSHKGDTTNHDSAYKMPQTEEVRYDQTVTLRQNEYIRKYYVSLKNAEPWLESKKSTNGNKNAGSKWVEYSFMGWKQGTALGSSPYYEVQDATGLFEDKKEVKNLTTTDNSTVTLYAAWKSNKMKLPETVAGEKGYTFIDWSDKAYSDNRVYNKAIANNKDSVNHIIKKNTDYKPYKDIILYAHWYKDVSLSFDLNGGLCNKEADDLKLSSTYYDYEAGYGFGIRNNPKTQLKGKYEAQINQIDAYGEYDDNGINGIFMKSDSQGRRYRLLGWSLDKNAKVPDDKLNVFDTNRATSYGVKDNTTLYAVWEPILQVQLQLDRSLGSLNGGLPNRVLATAVTNTPEVALIICPGEQASYAADIRGNISNMNVTFDTYITNIYNNQGTWTDNLNPNPTIVDEKRVDNIPKAQTHGLNRQPSVTSGSHVVRKFHIPQYLGTEQSEPSSIGIDTYAVRFTFTNPDSYFWNNIKKNPKGEQIEIIGYLYLPSENDDGEIKIPSILDELRSKLKIRLQ